MLRIPEQTICYFPARKVMNVPQTTTAKVLSVDQVKLPKVMGDMLVLEN